jgi:hypothetical protein
MPEAYLHFFKVGSQIPNLELLALYPGAGLGFCWTVRGGAGEWYIIEVAVSKGRPGVGA